MKNEFVEPSVDEFLLPSRPIQTKLPGKDDLLKSRNLEWNIFEADLRTGLAVVREAAKQRIKAGKKPNIISVSSVLRASSRGRTQFYEQHSEFMRRISLADRAMKRIWACTTSKQAPRRRTEADYKNEIRALKKQLKLLEQRQASEIVGKLAELFARR